MSQNNQESKAKNLKENTLEEVIADICGAFTIVRNPCEVDIPEIAQSTKEDLINRIVNKIRTAILEAIELDIGEIEYIVSSYLGIVQADFLDIEVRAKNIEKITQAIASAKDRVVRVR